MRYFPVWVATGGHNVIRRGPDCTRPAEAAGIIKQKLANGFASLGIVVKAEANQPAEPMETYIFPPAARKVIRHYLDLMDALDEGRLTRET